jgi:hypothetical protein
VSGPEPLLDDHGNPAVWTICDNCGLPSLCLRSCYTEASGPCELDPDYEDRVREVEPHLRILFGGAALLGEGGPLCGNCVAELSFCADREACERETERWSA